MGVDGPANAADPAARPEEHDVEAGAPATASGDTEVQNEPADARQETGLHHRHPHAAAAATNGSLAPSDSQAGLVAAKNATSSRGDLTSASSEKAGSDTASEEFTVQPATYKEIAWHFGILGWTAFGGPAAHIAMFQKLFVDKLRWCTYVVFTELLMLGQCMPGPTSTQMGFALGVLKKGLSGGLLSGALFQGPGLIMLAILGWVASKVLGENTPGWLDGLVAGLAAAGVALVASAALQLVRNICQGRLLQVICTLAAVVAYYWPKPWTFPALIVIGGLITLVAKRKDVIQVADIKAGVDRLGFNKLGGGILLVAWVAILVASIILVGRATSCAIFEFFKLPCLWPWRAAILAVSIVLSRKISYEDAKELHWFTVFYRTGSVIFGGGQVVLPMIYNDVVDRTCTVNSNNEQICTDSPNSWMTTGQFYAGLALAQAMPGPLFNFAAYLGAVIAQNAGVNAIIGVILCWVGLFAPGIILIFGILPFWGAFRQWQIYRRALPGLNASAVGLIVASVFQLTLSAWTTSPFPTTSICIGMLVYGATEVLAVPAPFAVVGGGVIGIIGWAANMV